MYRVLWLSKIIPILCFASQLQAVAAPVAPERAVGTNRRPPQWVALAGYGGICPAAPQAIWFLFGVY